MTPSSDWLSTLRSADLATVARACGVVWTLRQGRALRCPACGREDGHHGPVAVNGTAWFCHGCRAGGSGVDLLSWATLGSAPAGRWRELRAAAEARGLVGEDSGRTAAPAGLSRRPPPVPADETYPPADEVAALWAAARPLCDDAEASTWAHRRFAIEGAHRALAELDVCRVLRLGTPCPTWAGSSAAPWSASHRVLFAMHDSRGVMRALRARSTNPNATVKALPPRGYSARGLAMLDAVSKSHLLGGQQAGVFVVAEGEPQFLRAALESRGRWASIGIVSGSWPANHIGSGWAGHVPMRATVSLVCDDDESGDRYAADIRATLPGRDVRRWRP